MTRIFPLGVTGPQTLSALLLVPSHPCWPLTFHLMVLSYSWDHSLQPLHLELCAGVLCLFSAFSAFLLLKRSGGVVHPSPPMGVRSPWDH